MTVKQLRLKVIEEREYSVDCTSLERIVLNRGAFYGRETNGTRSNSLQMTGPNRSGLSSRVGSFALVRRRRRQFRSLGFCLRGVFVFELLSKVDLPLLQSLVFDASNCFAETSYAVVLGVKGRRISFIRIGSALCIPVSVQPDREQIRGSDDG